MKIMNVGRLMAWALVVAMPLWFGSCKKENANGGGDPVTPNSIEGSWKISGMKITDGKTTEDLLEFLKTQIGADAVACLTDTKIAFISGGKIAGTPSPSCKSNEADAYNPVTDASTWKVSGNKVTISDSDGPGESYDLNISGNTMTWSVQKQDDIDGDNVKETSTITLEFKRV